MESFSAIHAALGRVRARLVRQAAAEACLYALAAAVAAAVGIPLVGLAVAPARAPSMGGIALGVAAVAALAALVRWRIAARRWREPEALARHVGGRSPELSSDLLSTVQLEPAAHRTTAVSGEMIAALAGATATRLSSLDLDHVVPSRRLRAPALSLAGAGAIAALALAIDPGALADGWRRVAGADDGHLDGVRLSDVPLVGDVQITLEYPAYTGRPSVTLPAASGDFRAMPGTVARIQTTALEPIVGAAIVLGADADRELAMAVEGPSLSAVIEVSEPDVYRFRVQPLAGPPRVETATHAIEIEPDAAPAVELYAPADELDVEGRRRIELAYTAEDDYGIGDIKLVWDDGHGATGHLDLPPALEGSRSAQGKFLWDLAEVSLPAGARIAYHLEVGDNDTVSGPNIGRSRTYHLRVYSPRERHEMLMERQRALFENVVRLLGGRLVVQPGDLQTRDALNRMTRQIVVEIGGIVADLKEDKLAAPELSTTFRQMQARLEKLADAETRLLASSAPSGRKLATSDRKHVLELEDDVLALADWLDRQRLENMLAISDEIAERRERLEALFEEYARTGSAETLAEIERELRALEQRMAELARQQSQVSDDVLDKFMNVEALEQEEAQSCIDEVRQLMAAGEIEAAQAKMAECNTMFDEAAQSLEDMLAGLRGDRFSEQQRKLDEIMGDLADLARDEQDIAAAADQLMEQYAERAGEQMQAEAQKAREQAGAIIDKLRKRIDKIPRRGLTPFSSEELPVVEQRVDDVERMLADGDLAEALAMARQAELGLDTIEAELGADLDSGNPWNDRTPDAYNQVNRALPVARELVELLEKSTPAPEQIMSPEDLKQMRQLRRRQQSLRERAQKLAQRAREMNQDLPGSAGEAMAESLEQATQPMQRAEQRMRANDPSGARLEARDAADRLEQAQQQARGAARQQMMGNRGFREEPVRIPGADEYKAPEEFREEILEAMKKEAPSGFGDQVRRYYEELIR